jgi:hypothetical protein
MKRLLPKNILVGVMVALVSLSALSGQESYEVYTNAIPGLLSEDLKGPFVDLTEEIGKRANIQLTLKVVPAKIAHLVQGQAVRHHFSDVGHQL